MKRTHGLLVLVFALGSMCLRSGDSVPDLLRKVQTLNGARNAAPLSVHYVLDEKFCCRCLSGELQSGWIPTYYFTSGWLRLFSWVLDSNGTLRSHDCAMNEGIASVDSSMCNNASVLRSYCGKALVSDSNGKVVTIYKIAGNDQIRTSKMVDSLYTTQRTDSINSTSFTVVEVDTIVIPYKPGNTPFFVPSIFELKPLIFLPSQSSVGRFNKESKKYSWIRLIPKAQTFIDQRLPARDMFNLRQVDDTTFVGLSVEHYAPVDTVIQNERALFYSKRREALDLFVLSGDTLISKRILTLPLGSIDSIVPTVAGSTSYGLQRNATLDTTRLVYFDLKDTVLNVIPQWKMKCSDVRAVYGIDSSVAVLNVNGSVQVFDKTGLKYQFQTVDFKPGLRLSPRLPRLSAPTCSLNYSEGGRQVAEMIDDLGMRRSMKLFSESNQYLLLGQGGQIASYQRVFDKNGLNIIVARRHVANAK